MDIAEKMAADIALAMDGGEWKDGKWYSKFHRDAWIKAVKPYADEIERLWEAAKDRPKDRPNEAANEIERLREEMADLKYKKTYFERAYMAARRTLDSKGIHMDYFLSRADYEAALKEGE